MSANDRDSARDDAIVRAAVRAARAERDASPRNASGAESPCPDEEALAARHEGRLPSREARAIDAHAALCARCAGVLHFLAEERSGEPVPGSERAADAAAVARRRNRIALALGIAAVTLLVVGARLLFIVAGGEGWGTGTRALRAGGVVIAARGGARVAGADAPVLPGDCLAAGALVALGDEGEIVLATDGGFETVSARRGRRSPAGDPDSRKAVAAIHANGVSQPERLQAARDSMLRAPSAARTPLYPTGTIVDPRPEFSLAEPSATGEEWILRVERADGAAGGRELFRVGPVRLPCAYPADAPSLEAGIPYRWTLERAEGAAEASAGFELADAERRDRAVREVDAVIRAAGGGSEPDVLRPLAWIALGYPAEALRSGMAAIRSGRAAKSFQYEMGIAARGLRIEALALTWLK